MVAAVGLLLVLLMVAVLVLLAVVVAAGEVGGRLFVGWLVDVGPGTDLEALGVVLFQGWCYGFVDDDDDAAAATAARGCGFGRWACGIFALVPGDMEERGLGLVARTHVSFVLILKRIRSKPLCCSRSSSSGEQGCHPRLFPAARMAPPGYTPRFQVWQTPNG